MRVGVAVGDAVRAYALTHHTRHDLLFLVVDEQRRPAAEHLIQRSYPVHIGLVAVGRKDHYVVLSCRCTQVDLGRIQIPVNRFAGIIGCCLCGEAVREIHQQVHLLHHDLGQHGIEDIVLGISEGVTDLRTEYHFLTYDEVIGMTRTIDAVRQHFHRSCFDSRTTCLIEAVIDDCHRFGLTAQLADGRSEEHIGVGAYSVAAVTRRGSHFIARGVGVVILISPRPIMHDRDIHREGLAGLEGRTGITTQTLRSLDQTDIVRHTQSVLRP